MEAKTALAILARNRRLSSGFMGVCSIPTSFPPQARRLGPARVSVGGRTEVSGVFPTGLGTLVPLSLSYAGGNEASSPVLPPGGLRQASPGGPGPALSDRGGGWGGAGGGGGDALAPGGRALPGFGPGAGGGPGGAGGGLWPANLRGGPRGPSPRGGGDGVSLLPGRRGGGGGGLFGSDPGDPAKSPLPEPHPSAGGWSLPEAGATGRQALCLHRSPFQHRPRLAPAGSPGPGRGLFCPGPFSPMATTGP
jgi:hypothetical protein